MKRTSYIFWKILFEQHDCKFNKMQNSNRYKESGIFILVYVCVRVIPYLTPLPLQHYNKIRNRIDQYAKVCNKVNKKISIDGRVHFGNFIFKDSLTLRKFKASNTCGRTISVYLFQQTFFQKVFNLFQKSELFIDLK